MKELRDQEGHVGEAVEDEGLGHSDVLGEGGDVAGGEAVEEADEGATEHHEEEAEVRHHDLHGADDLHVEEGDEGVVEHDRDTVVEEGLSEHEEVETDVDVELLEDGEDGHWVNGGDEAGEDETLGGLEMHHIGCVGDGVENLEGAKKTGAGEAIETVADREGVEEGPEDGEDDDGDKVVKESGVVESEGRVEDDGGQEDVEEEGGCEDRKVHLLPCLHTEDVVQDDIVDEGADEDADDDEDAGLREDPGQPGEMVEDDLEDDS